MSRQRTPKKISLPKGEPAPPKHSAAEEAAWADEDRTASTGIYQDPSNPARFHRKGRGGSSERTVRRVTVYVADELATALDVYRAKAARNVNRSEVMELALRRFLETEGAL